MLRFVVGVLLIALYFYGLSDLLTWLVAAPVFSTLRLVLVDLALSVAIIVGFELVPSSWRPRLP